MKGGRCALQNKPGDNTDTVPWLTHLFFVFFFGVGSSSLSLKKEEEEDTFSIIALIFLLLFLFLAFSGGGGGDATGAAGSSISLSELTSSRSPWWRYIYILKWLSIFCWSRQWDCCPLGLKWDWYEVLHNMKFRNNHKLKLVLHVHIYIQVQPGTPYMYVCVPLHFSSSYILSWSAEPRGHSTPLTPSTSRLCHPLPLSLRLQCVSSSFSIENNRHSEKMYTYTTCVCVCV